MWQKAKHTHETKHNNNTTKKCDATIALPERCIYYTYRNKYVVLIVYCIYNESVDERG